MLLLRHYKILQTILIFLLVFVMVQSMQCTSRRMMVEPDRENTRLKRFSYLTFTNMGPNGCLDECIRRVGCHSFNYNLDLRYCELNKEPVCASVESHFTNSTGYSYVEIGQYRGIYMYNRCLSVPCGIGKYCKRLRDGTNVCVDDDILMRKLPKDCSELPAGNQSGVYTIYPGNNDGLTVLCDMDTDCGGWTVVQRRKDGSVDFYRDWESYKTGFGNVTSEFWIGNENLHMITAEKGYTVRFDLEDFSGNSRYAVYSLFRVGDKLSNYQVTIAGYNGDAGDSLTNVVDISGMEFSTKDKDNDKYSGRCSEIRVGGWWYKDCSRSNINGPYRSDGYSGEDSIYWRSWQDFKALKTTKMMIRPQL